MTREEKDAQIDRCFQAYLDGKEALECMKANLHRLYLALSALDFGPDHARINSGIAAAMAPLQSTEHDPECPVLKDLQAYVALTHEQKRRAAFLLPTRYGRAINEG